MKKAYDEDDNLIGIFDGRFICQDNGKKLYYIDGNEIFYIPSQDEGKPGKQGNPKIGEIQNGEYVSSEGIFLFTIK